MKNKLTWRIWLLIFSLIISLLFLISFQGIFQSGILVTNVQLNSTAYTQGFRQGQILTTVDGAKISSLKNFYKTINTNFPSNESRHLVFGMTKGSIDYYSKVAPEIIISKIPKTNLKLGLDLSGGSRALVKAKNKTLTKSELKDLIAVTLNRLNVFGLSDVKVLPITDLEGNKFMLIEIAGKSPRDLKNLIEEQGKFQAKINNQTVFYGGKRDVASVCRNDAHCSGIQSCNAQGSSYVCNYQFSITLSGRAARRQANATSRLGIDPKNPTYLSKKIDLFVDDKPVSSLFISKGLKGVVTTQISISGSGVGATRDDAYKNATQSMKKLQTILITGSLPFKLEVVKLDNLSPTLGKEFLKYIFWAFFFAFLVVMIIIFIRYRNIKLSLAVVLTSLSEVIIILGIASFINWGLDLPSIAGILATVGTGVDDQVVLLDESREEGELTLKKRLKRAFGIIFGSYFTSVASLIPLGWAVAGLFKGFAVTTIIGISAGVFITRPAFADLIMLIRKK